ncbi:uncharacterized protein LAESUDRAFT_759720 [Laetiporus sulphureus 93-53]|uniref:Uncharacterized protein n=1 Tax=Laetiporus sulphureus 93-53 TaxID=1314785 RepID=A0A165E3M7_9APHY|nr:uncharacterized protein LAESUDRAFT_759720 [Laetiporus sulphureus 93-53]KZT06188.1 hypothetical protein LAESUDRAFT_759720 [Laetiporus sulphureus 93-53]
MAKITEPHIRIDLMHSWKEAVFYPICFFWSTIVMNAISADSITSAYLTYVLNHHGICSPTIEINALAQGKSTNFEASLSTTLTRPLAAAGAVLTASASSSTMDV